MYDNYIGGRLDKLINVIGEREDLYITDHTGRLLKVKGILKVWAEAIITDIHYCNNKIYMGVKLWEILNFIVE